MWSAVLLNICKVTVIIYFDIGIIKTFTSATTGISHKREGHGKRLDNTIQYELKLHNITMLTMYRPK